MSKNNSQEASFDFCFAVTFWAFPVPELNNLVHPVLPIQLETVSWVASLCKAQGTAGPIPGRKLTARNIWIPQRRTAMLFELYNSVYVRLSTPQTWMIPFPPQPCNSAIAFPGDPEQAIERDTVQAIVRHLHVGRTHTTIWCIALDSYLSTYTTQVAEARCIVNHWIYQMGGSVGIIS